MSDAKKSKKTGYIDEWLDDEAGTGKKSKRTAAKKVVAPLDVSQANGTVTEVFPKLCHVLSDEDGVIRLCSYRRQQVFINITTGYQERSPVTVGDRVFQRILGATDGIVEGICERKNQVMRQAPGRDKHMIHVMASNVDQLIILSSVGQPDFSPGLIDRFLICAKQADIEPILVINKTDLSDEKVWQQYEDLGVQCFPISVKDEKGVKALIDILRSKASVFCGHSGVGKTSLFNLLTGKEDRIDVISAGSNKGKHTTTGSTLIPLADMSLIDTPGIKEIGLVGLKPEELEQYFPEFSNANCTESTCRHIDEPGCAAVEMLRYPSFKRIWDSLNDLENN